MTVITELRDVGTGEVVAVNWPIRNLWLEDPDLAERNWQAMAAEYDR